MFCDYGGVYRCEVGVFLFCNAVRGCADVCCSSVVCFLSLGVCVLLFRRVMEVVFFSLICDACSLKHSWSGSIFVSSCKCCVLLSDVHPGAVRNAAFCVI